MKDLFTHKIAMLRQRVVFLIILLITHSPMTFADRELSDELVNEYKSFLEILLSEAKSNPNDLELLKEIGKLYFYIGVETRDRNSTSKAIEIFENILQKKPYDSEIKAYLGSAITLKARDFPFVLSLTPLGFLRIHYVKKGIEKMDCAVEMDNLNPFVRLIRGVTCYNLPSIFGQLDKSIGDFNLLKSWIENPFLNKTYQEIFNDKSFKSIVYYHMGKLYLLMNDSEKASTFFKISSDILPESPYGRASKRMLSKIKQK